MFASRIITGVWDGVDVCLPDNYWGVSGVDVCLPDTGKELEMECGRWSVGDGVWEMECGRWGVRDGVWEIEWWLGRIEVWFEGSG